MMLVPYQPAVQALLFNVRSLRGPLENTHVLSAAQQGHPHPEDASNESQRSGQNCSVGP